MDTSSLVAIGLAALSGIGVVAWTVSWFWIRSVQRGIDGNSAALTAKAEKVDVEAVKQHLADLEVKSAEEHAAVLLAQSRFEADCNKNFVSNPALVQAMSSLDRAIQQLTHVIQSNAKESRDGIKAINDRIDNLMHNRIT
jgi:hypothetical protein